jgi:membrane-associated phospholipid phosphatase
MATDGRTREPGVRVVSAVSVATALLAVVALLDPFRTTLVAFGPFAPSTDIGVDELFFGGVSSIGARNGLILVAGLLVLALVVGRRFGDALFIVVAAIGAPVVSRFAKDLYREPRPPIVAQAAQVPVTMPLWIVLGVVAVVIVVGLLKGWGPRTLLGGGIVLAVVCLHWLANRIVPVSPGLDAFPSGHATGSATLAAAAVLIFWDDRRWRWPVTILAIAYAAAVGLSRLYLGVHYPADVVAGWSLGTAWVLILSLIWSALSRRSITELAGV